MNYFTTEYSFPSSDGKHNLHAEIYLPKTEEYKGIVQIAHGMIDHIGRYGNLVSALTKEGYIVAGNDHLGHGGSVNSADEFGFFADKGGVDFVIEDLYQMNRHLRHTYKGLPVILLGHSMGSFIARLYAVKHPHSVKGLIIHGTAGPNKALPLGKFLAALVSLFAGKRHRSKLVASMAFAGYNSRFPKEEGVMAWLTRDTEEVSDKTEDERTNFIFTISGYRDLFRFLGGCNSKDWFKSYPKELPTLIVSGDADPVGAYGKGPEYVYKKLMISGCKSLEIKMYPGARHELFNETNRDEIFGDINAWLKTVLK